jgi:hypothetical protein
MHNKVLFSLESNSPPVGLLKATVLDIIILGKEKVLSDKFHVNVLGAA